jgi:hypothetical protein
VVLCTLTLCVPKISSVLCDQVIFVDQTTDTSLFSDAVLVEINWLGRVSAARLRAKRGGGVRAENLVRCCDQQSCPLCRPAMMITGHVPAVRLPPDHADGLMAAAISA